MRGDQRAEAEAGEGPSRGSQSTCGTVCPQQGQCWAAPCALQASAARAGGRVHLLCQHCLSTLSLANTVCGDHQRRSPRLALVAGSRGLGRGGLAGWPTPDTLSIC